MGRARKWRRLRAWPPISGLPEIGTISAQVGYLPPACVFETARFARLLTMRESR